MLSGFRDLVDGQIKKQQRSVFRRRLLRVQNKDFTVISSNCIGGALYQLMGIPYATPCVGLFFFAPCFVRFVSNFREYVQEDLVQIDESRYMEGNVKRQANQMYPLGKLGDIEIHFMHYSSWDEVLQKWIRRANRINFDNLFFLLTDQDLCTYPILKAYDQLPFPKKVCFTAKKYDLESCVQVPYYANAEEVGNLVANYHLFNKCFDFVRWFDEPALTAARSMGSSPKRNVT